MTDNIGIPIPPGFPTPKIPPYGTWIPGRNPEFKTHRRKGDATNSVICHVANSYTFGRKAVIYEYKDNEWQAIRIYEAPTHCQACGWDFSGYEEDNTRWRYKRRRNLCRQRGVPTLDAKVVCDKCYPKFERSFDYDQGKYVESTLSWDELAN